MGRLVDIDAVIKAVDRHTKDESEVVLDNDITCILEEVPTAYDVEKVVAELEEELKRADIEKQRCASENPMQFDVVKGYSTGISNALEIVRNGGKE